MFRKVYLACCIVREYGIPSIVGVKGACNLGDSSKVPVDVFLGRITVH